MLIIQLEDSLILSNTKDQETSAIHITYEQEPLFVANRGSLFSYNKLVPLYKLLEDE